MPLRSIVNSDLSPDDNSQIVELKSSEKMVTYKKNKYKPIPPFIAYGSGQDHYKEKNMNSIDPMYILINLKSREKAFYTIAYSELRKNNSSLIVKITTDGMTKSQAKNLYSGYAGVRKVDLMRRYSKGTYMFNPKMFVLTGYKGEYKDLIDQYEKLK